MPPVPTAEKPPEGLNAEWLGVWRHALKVLKDQGTWAWEQKPLLDEYVFALIAAQDARKGFAWLDHLEEAVASDEIDWISLRQIAGALPTQWDRHAKRAAALADKLILTPEAQKRHGLYDEPDEEVDGFDALDELAPRRDRKTA